MKLCIKSLKKNSNYNHQIIPHVNIGDDGSIDFLQKKILNILLRNIMQVLCEGMNMASKKAKNDFILYAHDAFIFVSRM